MNGQLEYLIKSGYLSRAKISQTDSIFVKNPSGIITEYCATSVRITIIGREKPGGPLGERYGIVCAINDRKQTRYTLGGGRIEPSVNLNRTGEEEAEESVLSCLKREVLEELKINIDPENVIEGGEIPRGLLLIGVRVITETDSDEPKRRLDGRTCVDACFLMIIDERLGYSEGFKGETGTRTVLSPQELLSYPKKGELMPLPQPQKLALAMAIIFADEVFNSDECPGALQEIIRSGLHAARHTSETSRWRKHFILTIQH